MQCNGLPSRMHATWWSQLPQPLPPLLLAGCSCPLPVPLVLPSSRCQRAAVATAGTTCRRAHACSLLLRCPPPASPLLKALFGGVSITYRRAMGFVPCSLSKSRHLPTCLQAPQKSAWVPSCRLLIMNQSTSIPSVRLLVQQL